MERKSPGKRIQAGLPFPACRCPSPLPPRSAGRTLGLAVLRCYLLAAIIVLAVRAVQLALDAAR